MKSSNMPNTTLTIHVLICVLVLSSIVMMVYSLASTSMLMVVEWHALEVDQYVPVQLDVHYGMFRYCVGPPSSADRICHAYPSTPEAPIGKDMPAVGLWAAASVGLKTLTLLFVVMGTLRKKWDIFLMPAAGIVLMFAILTLGVAAVTFLFNIGHMLPPKWGGFSIEFYSWRQAQAYAAYGSSLYVICGSFVASCVALFAIAARVTNQRIYAYEQYMVNAVCEDEGKVFDKE